jgi:hypothetical protein
MFLGDGLSVPTLAAARTYLGQLQGRTGEETVLSFEAFPHTGLSKVRNLKHWNTTNTRFENNINYEQNTLFLFVNKVK